MALDNWFQNWHPPDFHHQFYEPIKNYSNGHEYYSRKESPNPNKILPLFLSLNLLKPPEKTLKNERHRTDSHLEFLPPKREEHNPLEYQGNANKETYFSKHGNSRFHFGIPRDQLKDIIHEKTYIDRKEKVISNLRTAPLELAEKPNQRNKYSNIESHPNVKISSGNPGSAGDIQDESYGHLYTDSLEFPDPFRENTSRKSFNMTYEEQHNLRPLERTGSFKTWYRWKVLDFKYSSDLERSEAISSGEFVPENNLPLGIEVYKDRIFLSMPKWKPGVPVTLAHLPRVPKDESPQLVPYPNWDWHSEKSCELITSVFRMYADQCGRLWVLDSGKVSITTEEAKQHCPPKLLIFDLETDELLEKFIFPDSFIKEDSLYSNIVVDIRQGDCHDAYAYMVDVWRFGLVVFRLIDHKAWRLTDHLFFPDPLAASYQLHHLKFEWTDGIFGIALGPVDHFIDDRVLYFHPMSSFREFYVKTSYLRDENGDENRRDAYKVLGQSRGPSGHVSSSVMDENGIMYYNLVTRDSIGCWDSRKPYKRENLGVIGKSKETLVFPNDIRLDKEKRQSIWIVTNRLPYYLIEGLDVNRINFRVMSAYTDESIKGTICDPKVHNHYTYVKHQDVGDCY